MNIFGWDTVTALSVGAVNRALAANSNQLIQEFKVSGETFGNSYELQGEFGPWQVVAGGSGSLLRLSVPIATGSIRPGVGAVVDLAGSTAVLEVSLDLLPTADGRSQHLVFALDRAATTGAVPQPGAVTPVSLSAPAAATAELGTLGVELVLDGVAQALASDASAVSYVLASVNLVPPTANSWLTPVQSAYVYQEVIGAGSYLAILSTVSSRDIAQLPRTVDPELFSGGGDAAFAISEDLFLEQLIRPALPQVFGGSADASCFGYDPVKHVITAARQFGIAEVKEGAIWYTPNVTTLSLGVVGGALAMAVNGTCDLKAGISMDFWVTSQYPMIYQPATARISFGGDPHATSGHSAHIPWWFWAGGLLVEAITQIVVSVITDSLSSELSSRFGSVGLAALAGQPVAWQGMSQFDVVGARLNGSLMISGNAG